MITIIKQGTKRTQECNKCGCLFSFDDTDVEIKYTWMVPMYKYINCPQCKEEIELEHLYNPDEEEE